LQPEGSDNIETDSKLEFTNWGTGRGRGSNTTYLLGCLWSEEEDNKVSYRGWEAWKCVGEQQVTSGRGWWCLCRHKI